MADLKFSSVSLEKWSQICCSETFAKSTAKHLCWCLFLNNLAACRPVTILERDFCAGFYQWILLIFSDQFFYLTSANARFLPGRNERFHKKSSGPGSTFWGSSLLIQSQHYWLDYNWDLKFLEWDSEIAITEWFVVTQDVGTHILDHESMSGWTYKVLWRRHTTEFLNLNSVHPSQKL